MLPGTFAGNRLKKFVKREGIYEPERLADRSEEEEEEEEGIEEGSELVEGEISGDPFEIVVPQLDESKRGEYLRYESFDV